MDFRGPQDVYSPGMPPEISPPNSGTVAGSVNAEHAAVLQAQVDGLKTEFWGEDSEAKFSNLRVIADGLKNDWLATYQHNTSETLRKFGLITDRPTHELKSSTEPGGQGLDVREHDEPVGADSEIFKIVQSTIKAELSSLFLTDAVKIPVEEILEEARTAGHLIVDILTTKQLKIEQLIKSFGTTPEVLASEARQRTKEHVSEKLLGKIASLGSREEKPAKRSRTGAFFDTEASKLMTRGEHDGYVEDMINRYKPRTAESILKDYTQRAVMYYARSVYGEASLVLDQGMTADTIFFDSFQAQHGVDVAKPISPNEAATLIATQWVGMHLFGDKGRWTAQVAEAVQAQEKESFYYRQSWYESRKEKLRDEDQYYWNRETWMKYDFDMSGPPSFRQAAAFEMFNEPEEEPKRKLLGNLADDVEVACVEHEYPLEVKFLFVEECARLLLDIPIDDVPSKTKLIHKILSAHHSDKTAHSSDGAPKTAEEIIKISDMVKLCTTILTDYKREAAARDEEEN